MSIVKLPASSTMTVEQALDSARGNASDLSEVLIIGTDKGGNLFVRSSRMNRSDALWLAKQAEMYALDGDRK